MAEKSEANGRVINRRRFLQWGALTLGAVAVNACTSAPAAAPTAAPRAEATQAGAPAAPTPTTATTGATTAQPVEILFNTWWTPLQDAFTVLIKEFQDQNPGVTVKTQFITTDYAQAMAAALTAGTFGDAATSDNGVQSKWQSGGYHYDLTAYVDQDKLNLQKDYSLGGLEIWCGKVMNLPMDADDRAIYYNKTMLKEAGAPDPWDDLKGNWTWDDLVKIGKACTKKDASGKIVQYGFQTTYTDTEDNEGFIWSLGGNYADWTTGKYNYLDPAVIKAWEMMYDWATKDQFLITQDAISSLTGATGVNPFRAGIVAMYLRASYDSTINEKEIGNKFEWDAAPFPKPGSYNPKGEATPPTTANPNFVPKAAKHPEDGYKFLAYLCGDRAEQLYAQKKTMMVAKKSAWKTYQDTPPPKHAGSFVWYVYGRPHGYHYYSDIMNEVMYSTVQPEIEKAFLGQQTIKQALETAQKKIDTLGKSQSAPCDNPYGQNASPQPPLPQDELDALGVKPYFPYEWANQ